MIEKRPNFLIRFAARIARWFRETKSELKKVVWPTRKQLINNTAIVLGMVAVVGAVIAGLDTVFLLAIHRLLPALLGFF
jgi:preprotein translocase subunit SecE